MVKENKIGLHIVPPEGFLDFLKLIRNNGEINISDLKKALEKGSIKKEEYTELVTELLERTEIRLEKAEIGLVRASEEVKRTKDELEKAGIDGLTSLLRRDVFEAKLKKLIEELISTDNRYSSLNKIMIIRLDINNFKKFNESPYDHLVGDQALSAFAKHLKDNTQEEHDILCRFGGDEFAVLIKISDDSVDLEKLFLNIKERINTDFSIEVKGEPVLVGSSIGYSVLERGKFSETDVSKIAIDLLAEADESERENKLKIKEKEAGDYSI